MVEYPEISAAHINIYNDVNGESSACEAAAQRFFSLCLTQTTKFSEMQQKVKAKREKTVSLGHGQSANPDYFDEYWDYHDYSLILEEKKSLVWPTNVAILNI